jgi:transposase
LGGSSGRKTDEITLDWDDNTEADPAGCLVMPTPTRWPSLASAGRNLQVVEPDEARAVLKLLSDRRQQLIEQRITAVNRLHQLLAELLPGRADRRLTPAKAR